MRRSALRQHGRPPSSRKTKSVQWVSDIKKKPQDISSDRKIVKSQVLLMLFLPFFSVSRLLYSSSIKALLTYLGYMPVVSERKSQKGTDLNFYLYSGVGMKWDMVSFSL